MRSTPSSSSSKPDRRSPPKPPPNYFSRRVQWRLMLMVFTFMAVIVLMLEARKPENWRWMGFREAPVGGEPLSDEEIAERDIDTRLHPRDAEAPLAENGASPDAPQVLTDEAAGPVERARVDRWRRLFEELSADQQDLLRRGLLAARRNETLEADRREAWNELVDKLQTRWEALQREALASLEAPASDGGENQLTHQQRERWRGVLDELKNQWTSQTRPALEAVAGDQPPSEQHRQALAGVRELVDRRDLAQVRDDMVLRSDEFDAWFRLFDRLREMELAELTESSTGRVGFLQLFEQPEAYRGKLVTVRGTARMAYHVTTRDNLYDIPGYYVFVVQPAGGPNSPIFVYSLEKPPGFPEIKDRDLDRETTSLNEEVQFTGYFFKRWAYRAKDDIRLAPLLLAKAPRWEPPPPPADTSQPFRPAWLAIGLAAAAVVAVGVALFAYRQSRGSSAPHYAGKTGPQLEIDDSDVRPPIDEALRARAESEQGSS